jgi:N-acylneuraminate cytidylyltransferase
MKSIGFIPLRKNSKGILGKNKRKLLGRPLFCWVLTEAIFSDLDRIFIYTDDLEIIEFINREYSWTSKVEVLKRSNDSATDEASTEMAILEFCKINKYDFDVFCLLQATSPFTQSKDINNSLKEIRLGKDSCISVVSSHRFFWNKDGTPLNYDFMNRPRRQDFEGTLIENGAIYCTTKDALEKSNNRISGDIGFIKMPDFTFTEIDSESDWKVVELLLKNRLQTKRFPKKIKHLFLDVDGVFTNGRVLYSEKGEFAKSFDMRDGMGLEILRQDNIEVTVMTSEQSTLVASRMKKLNIDKVYLGVKDKFGLLQHISKTYNIEYSNIAYLGDDINDMACMLGVGWSLAPNNAMSEIKRISDINLLEDSGSGTIREACKLIIKYNKRFE